MRLSFVPKILIIALAIGLLSGCKFYKDSNAWKKPLPPYLVKQLKKKGFKVGGHIMSRLFKDEDRFEVWMEKDGRFKFFKSYSICKWSGVLGPKVREGDNQAPEGFYVVSPAQMNPRSKYYLSFNLGYPNFYDRAHGRTGAHLMVHGECSSRGCYALTNANIEEVYLLARDAFKNGQRRFHVQAFPFRLNEFNLNKHKDSKWIGFWRNLAEGDAIFKRTKLPPKMSVVNKRYVFSEGEPLTSTKPAWIKPKPLVTKPAIAKPKPVVKPKLLVKPTTLAKPSEAISNNVPNQNPGDKIIEKPKPNTDGKTNLETQENSNKSNSEVEQLPEKLPAELPKALPKTPKTPNSTSLFTGTTPTSQN